MSPAEQVRIAMLTLESGGKFPYDAPDSWWNRGVDDNPPPPAIDWAHYAARGVLHDLQDRRGIKQGFVELDEEIRADIVRALADIIRLAKSVYR